LQPIDVRIDNGLFLPQAFSSRYNNISPLKKKIISAQNNFLACFRRQAGDTTAANFQSCCIFKG